MNRKPLLIIVILFLLAVGVVLWLTLRPAPPAGEGIPLMSNECGEDRRSPAGFCWGIAGTVLDSMELIISGTSWVEGQHSLLLVGIDADWGLEWNDVTATVTDKEGLIYLSMESKPFSDQATGEKGKSEYERIRQLLSDRLGPPTHELKQVSRALPGGGDEAVPEDYFYSCLTRADGQCAGVWMASWEKDGKMLANLDLINASRSEAGNPTYAGRLVVELNSPFAAPPKPQ